jgi:hypothetical protein
MEQIKEVLQTALELDSHSRGQFLDSACAENGSMRGEVESLLQSYEPGQLAHLSSSPGSRIFAILNES